MKVVTWNINCRSSKGGIPKMVIKELLRTNADVACLTEFVKGENYHEFIDELRAFGYEVFTDPRTTEYSGNEILIAVKSEYAIKTETFVICNDDKNPNFLHVTITRENEKKINLVGVRVKIMSPKNNLSKDEREKFQINEAKERMCQVNNLASYLQKMDGKIYVMGDWNNYFYDDNSKVDSWKLDKAYLQNYYSYPLLVNKMETLGLTNYTPQGNRQSVYSWVNKNIWSNKKYIRNDHVFSNTKVYEVTYCWEFTNSTEYISDKVGYPDHAMLIFTI